MASKSTPSYVTGTTLTSTGFQKAVKIVLFLLYLIWEFQILNVCRLILTSGF